jgi:predicted amidophosphoribosyltransferase
MSEHFQLSSFDIRVSGENTVVLVSGPGKYYDIIRDAFPEYRFSRRWSDNYGKFKWGTYVYEIRESDRQKIKALLELCQNTICINDVLKQSFSLSYHGRPSYAGGGRTEIGELLYQAKYQQDKSKALQLVDHLKKFILCHPSYQRTELIMAVPFYGQKTFDLPTFLSSHLCQVLAVESGQSYIRKIKDTKKMKNLSREEKFINLRDAFEVVTHVPLNGRLITLIDDVYQSGETMHAVASALISAGAVVQGLTVTKTVRSSNLG